MKLAPALFLSAAILLAQPPSQTDTTAAQKKPGTVEGTVVNSATGLPVTKKATVTLRNGRGRFTYVSTSDTSGHFRFDGVEPGDFYIVAAECSGFTPATPNRQRIPTIRVSEGQRVTAVSVQLAPLGVISGKVLSEDGEPVPRASVAALQYTYQMGARRLQSVRMASTDDRGEYRLFDLREGIYYIQVSFQNFSNVSMMDRVHRDRPEQAYPTVFHPGVTEISGATAISLPSGGDAAGIDFRLRETRVYHIRGKAVDAQTGEPITRTGIAVMNCAPGMDQSSTRGGSGVGPDGAFDIGNLVPGPYCLQVQRNMDGKFGFARRDVNLGDRDLNDIILSVAPALTIKGTVTVEGTPPPGWKVNQIYLSPQSGFFGGASARVEDDGSFTMENVPPQTYTLQLNFGPGAYLKSIRLGDRDMSDGRIDITSAGGTFALVFDTAAGELKGSVQDEKGDPAASSYVTVSPDDRLTARRDLFKTGFSDNLGNFGVTGLAPGVYKVLAWRDPDMNLIQSPEFRSLFEGSAATVTVGSNGHETVTLRVVPADDVEQAKKKLR
jgi:hypothetical protein